MREKTLQTIKSCDYFTLMLDESTDESNRSELSHIFRIVNNEIIENHFLDLMQLQRCDAETIFKSFETNLRDSGVEIQRIKFAGMDGCSTMSGENNGVKAHFQNSTAHFNYIHCRNHRLALCFAHLIPQFDEFKNFDSLLLNL